MKLSIDINELKKRSLFVATPMYGGQCAGMYTKSIADLSSLCTKYGIALRFYFLFNESLITRARNYCCDEFIRSDFTHMMFIDSDIGFDPNDVIAMLALSEGDPEGKINEGKPFDILCGPYPKKCIAWEKVKAAVDKGVADENPNELEKYVGDYVINPTKNNNAIRLDDPVQIREGGTGFMLIRKPTFKMYDEMFPEQSYKPDHVRTEAFDGSREIMAYFDCIIDPETKRYLSEDYMFCYNIQKAGGAVWLCPWMKLQHVGSYIFGGSLQDLANVGASATADMSKIGKKRTIGK